MSHKNCKICNYSIPDNEKKVSSPDGEIVICYKCIETAFLQLAESIQKFSNNAIDNKLLEIINKKNKDFINKNKDIYEEDDEKNKDLKNFYPQMIHQKLNDYIIGQEETKKIISVAIYQHLTRMSMLDNLLKTELDEDLILKKSNILLIGDSGSGKTLIAETISKILNIPIVIADATSLTSKGYVGGDIEDILQSLLNKSNNQIEVAERGIIFIDEIDKLSSNYSENIKTKDVSGTGVQENLLKIMEGTVVQLKNPRFNHMQGGSQTIEMDTKNILFIFGGAFSGLDKIIKEYKNNKSSMGFKTNIEEEVEKQHNIIDYIIDYGFSPEFLGRIPVISILKPLSKEDLLEIITKPKNSILKQYETFFKNSNITFEFSDKALNKVVKEIQSNKIGARALKKIFENIFINMIYNISEYENTHIVIEENFILTEDLKDLKVTKKEQEQQKISPNSN